MDSPHISYTFMHGFGCDSSFWDRILPLFSFPYIVWDRGYYYSPCTDSINSTIRIGVGHSLGLIHLLESDISFDIYVGLQSFIDFIGGYSERKDQLNRMKIHLQNAPQQTLQYFCRRCGFPYPDKNPDMNQIYIDYEKLYHRYEHMIEGKTIYLCSTEDDVVVPYQITQKNFPKISIYKAPPAKHALGYLQSNYIVKYLESLSHKIIVNK